MIKDRFYEPGGPHGLLTVMADRREFLKTTGIGLYILFAMPMPESEAQTGREYPDDINAYLHINPSGKIKCFTGKIEMGQGIITSLAQMLAEELDAPFTEVEMVMGDTQLCPFDNATVGSRSTKYFGPALRQAAADARTVLLQLAAQKWNRPVERLYARDGMIMDQDHADKRIAYGDLVQGQSLQKVSSLAANLKPIAEHSVSGKPYLRTDSRAKVTGAAQFAGDIRLPGMLYAKILRPPSHGAKRIFCDTQAARAIPGVVVIEEGDMVAVLHEKPDVAEKARSVIQARYEESKPAVDGESIFKELQRLGSSAQIVMEKGDVDSARTTCAQVKEMTFYNQYVAHAPIEPHTALVEVAGDKVNVWASTQSPFRVRDSVAQVLALDKEKVHVRTPFVGGGFGGKTWALQATEAALLAKGTGRPVQVAWTREEEFFYDSFRPAAVLHVAAGVDEKGRISFWQYENYFAGARSSEPIYDIPNIRVSSLNNGRDASPHPFNTGAWRGPGSNSNVFAMESHCDTLASLAGMDPLTFRLQNLSDERMKKALRSAAEQFGYSFAKSPSDEGVGIACTNYLNTYVVTMAKLRIERRTGMVRVEKMVCAQDMGEIINPQGARLQIEGCLTMGISAALSEEIRFYGGKIFTSNFDTYELTRFSQLPQIKVILIDNPSLPPQGCGEPAITTVAAALANAIHDAVGVRMKELPMTPERIKKELIQMERKG
jgi:nicotinate dehydrogenase subunit B